ncbi:MAG: hypothetical protein AB9835_12280 [Eubacteriales bacterium]
MEWDKNVIDDLSRYNTLKTSLGHMKKRIEIMNHKINTLKRFFDPSMDEELLDLKVKREFIKRTYNRTLQVVKAMDKGLSDLDERENKVLSRFYISPFDGSIERLMEELGIKQTQAYREKDKALQKFTISMLDIKE